MKALTYWLLTLTVFSFLIAGFLHPVTAFTQDLGRHLLMGKIIVTTHTVPSTNLLSYTYPNFPFINHHYLSEVVFYLINQAFGSNGLLIIMTAVVVMAFGIVFFYAYTKGALLPFSLLSFFYLQVLFERTDIRPEMFGYFFISLFIVMLYRYRDKYSRWILILIPLELLWVQLHISFIIGILVICLFFVENTILHRKNLNNPATKLLFFVLLFSTLLTVINPNGITGALYPFHIFQNYGYTIEENQNIFLLESLFFKPTIPYFKLCVLFLLLALISVAKKTRIIDWLLSVTFIVLAASAVRNFPLFVFATIIPSSLALNAIFLWLKPYLAANNSLRFIKPLFPIILILLFLWKMPAIPASRGFGLGSTTGAQKAADFYNQQQLHGPVFNNFDIGSYLESRMYPSQKVFIDGRPEAFPVSFFRDVYIPMQESPQVFAQIEKKYHFNTIFFSHTDQTPWGGTFIQQIIQNKTWIPVYIDHDVIILVKDTTENETVIKQFGMTQDTLHASHTEMYSSRELLQLINFYLSTKNQPQAIELAKQVSDKDPANCQILSFLLSSLSQTQNEPLQLYLARYNKSCQ